jgi:hypothetical protein
LEREGVAYSLGAVMEFTRWPILWAGVIGTHEIFHNFVLIGAGSHWLFIYNNAHRPEAEILHIHIKEFVTICGFHAIGENELIDIKAETLDEIHIQIHIWVNDNSHEEMTPLEIRLSHSKIL